MLAPTVFISYSHRDRVWKERLVDHLGVLENGGLLRAWDDQAIGTGGEWLHEIRSAMDSARVAILLISAKFLTSSFILDEEVPRLLERRMKEGLTVFPVIVRDCAWQEVSWLAKLQVRRFAGKPLSLRAGFIDSDLAQIAREVLEILRAEPRSIKASGLENPAGTAFLPALHQLPSPPADFIGRQEDLAALRSALAGCEDRMIFGLCGMGGIGKTALALKLSIELASRYPDAQFYLDLKGVDPQPLSAAQAMAHVVRSFHPDSRLPDSETELASLYRSVLHGKRTLLLMDNAAGGEQVEPLIPPVGSLLLVTSRFHFVLPGLVTRNLEELSEEEASALLLQIAPRIGTKALEIAHLCGRLPLALRVAGSTLAERPDLTPANYSRWLKEGKKRLDPVKASLTLSYELLDGERQRLWRKLSVFPGTFDAEAAAAIWELELDTTLDVLSELIRCSIVEWEEQEQRYHLHDLVRELAYGQLKPVEREPAQRKHSAHFLKVFHRADNLYRQGGEAIGRGLQLFDTEWVNIREGQAWAETHFKRDDEAAAIYAAYPSKGMPLLSLRLHPHERIRWLEVALDHARQQNARDLEGYYLGHLGLAHASLGDLRYAAELHQQHLAIARETGNRHGEARALGRLATLYRRLGKPRNGIELYEQYLALTREIGDRRSEGHALGGLGVAFNLLGDSRKAITYHEQRLAIAREIGDLRSEANALGGMAITYRHLGELRLALKFHEQHLAIAEKIGDRRGVAGSLGGLGLAYAALGEPQKAIELYESWLATSREFGDRRSEANALANLGISYVALGEPQRAIELYDQSLTLARDIGDRRSEATTLGNLGSAYTTLGEPGRGIELFNQQIEISREIGDSRSESRALDGLGLSYAALGELPRAAAFHLQSIDLNRALEDRRGEARARWNLGLLYEKMGDTVRAAEMMRPWVDYELEMGHADAEGHAAQLESLQSKVPGWLEEPVDN